METYTATRYPRDPPIYDIDTLFWGALIFLALFVSCFLLWKAIQGRGNQTPLDRSATTRRRKAPRDPEVPGPEISWDPKDLLGEPWSGQEHTEGMNQQEQEEFLLAYGPRKVRRAIKERREQAEKRQSDS